MNSNLISQIKQISGDLYRYFCATFSNQLAEDLVQITLIRLVEKIKKGDFDSSKGTLRMFAFGIARFVRLESLRSRVIYSLEDNEEQVKDQNSDPAQSYENKDNLHVLKKAISQLGPIQQDIICLYLDEEIGYKEISTILDMPLGTVKSHISRAKEQLKKIIEGENYGQ